MALHFSGHLNIQYPNAYCQVENRVLPPWSTVRYDLIEEFLQRSINLSFEQ